MKKVLLLATGGTIACTHSEEGLTPGMSGDGILELLPELREGFAIESRDILNLDSSNIQPEEWQFMAEQVAEPADGLRGGGRRSERGNGGL